MDKYLNFHSCGQEENTLKLIGIYSLRTILFTKSINILFSETICKFMVIKSPLKESDFD